MGFGEKLAKALAAAELTQNDLASKLRVSKSTVSGWMNGTHGMRVGHLKAAAKLLKIDEETMSEWVRESITDQLAKKLDKLTKATKRGR